MENILIQFAAAQPEQQGMFGSLGIDWKLLLLQSIAFLLLLWLLKKFVYPPLSAMLDKREADIRASADAAMEAEQHAAEAEARTAELLDKAKAEASEIVETARGEASQIAETAHKKAEAKTSSMISLAKEEISREIAKARQLLQSETLDLVALATGKVLDQKVDSQADQALIAKAVKGLK